MICQRYVSPLTPFQPCTTTDEAQSDDETSDEEKQKELIKKKEEESKRLAAIGNGKDKDVKPSSGSSTKGSTTPSHRPKHIDPTKRSSSSNHLKRPGSPNLSESSGNESSRKKHKKKHVHSSTSAQVTGTSTPRAGSRPMSPAPGQAGKAGAKVGATRMMDVGQGMSEGEATAGEMSDGAGGVKPKKLKLRLGGSGNASPAASRAASPAMASRAGSPAGNGGVGRSEFSIRFPPLPFSRFMHLPVFDGTVSKPVLPAEGLRKTWLIWRSSRGLLSIVVSASVPACRDF